MADYLWRLWDFRAWREVGYLPLRNVSFDWQLNGIGGLQASMGLQRGIPPIRPGQHCLIVERNGLPAWAGPIWSMDFDSSSAYVQFRASEWASYLRRRRIRWDNRSNVGIPTDDPENYPPGMYFRGWDQFDIARELLHWTQADNWGWGDLHISPTAGLPQHERTLSGVTRDRNYAGTDRKEIWEAMTQLGEVINGFDQRLRVTYFPSRNNPTIWWEGFYPRQSSTQERHGTVLEYREGWPGSNVTGYRWSTKADEMINIAEAANDEVVATAFDASMWDFYPCLDGLAQKGGEGGVTSLDTLQQHADALLLENKRVMNTGAIAEIRPDSLPELGPDLVGAEVRIRLTSWRHPPGPQGQPGLDQLMRIMAIGINAPSDERAESVSMELAPMPLEPWSPLSTTPVRELVGARNGSR